MLCSLTSAHCSLTSAHCSLLTVHCSLLTVHCSLFTDLCSLLTVHCSLFTDLCSLFTDLCSLFTVHCSLLTDLYSFTGIIPVILWAFRWVNRLSKSIPIPLVIEPCRLSIYSKGCSVNTQSVLACQKSSEVLSTLPS